MWFSDVFRLSTSDFAEDFYFWQKPKKIQETKSHSEKVISAKASGKKAPLLFPGWIDFLLGSKGRTLPLSHWDLK